MRSNKKHLLRYLYSKRHSKQRHNFFCISLSLLSYSLTYHSIHTLLNIADPLLSELTQDIRVAILAHIVWEACCERGVAESRALGLQATIFTFYAFSLFRVRQCSLQPIHLYEELGARHLIFFLLQRNRNIVNMI